MDNGPNLARLRVTYPDGHEEYFSVGGSPYNIGRPPGNDLQLPDGKVSHHHARLVFEGDRTSLVDTGSRNGTRLGTQALQPNIPYPIQPGDVFTIGPYRLEFQAAPKEPITAVKPPVQPRVPYVPPVPPAGGQPPALPPEPPAEIVAPIDPSDYGISSVSSRYLEYLPPIYTQHPFLGQFLLAFEAILTPIEQSVDNFDFYLDANTTPEFFMGQLAAWLGLTLDEHWPLAKRRVVVAEAAELYAKRGTRTALIRHLQIYTDQVPEIIEPDDKAHHFIVGLNLKPDQTVNVPTIERIIEANKPAHTTYSLKITYVP